MGSILSLISNCSNSHLNFLAIVPSVPTTIGITVTHTFHGILNFLARSEYWSIFSVSFIFIPWTTGMAKDTRRQVFFFLIINSRCVFFWLGLGDQFVSKNVKEFYVPNSQRRILVCAYTMLLYGNIKSFAQFPGITYSTQSYLAFFSFCVSLLHSLMIWSTVSSLSLHNLQLPFCCLLSIFTQT